MKKSLQDWLYTLRPPSPLALAIFGIAIVATMVWLWLVSNRQKELQQLYSEASGSSFNGSQSAADAIRKLATYNNEQSTKMLLDIAAGDTPIQLDDLRIKAIQALQGRKSDTVAVGLASLLQPHTGLDMRLAIADSLQHRYCNEACVGFVLHYLERVLRGDPNFEDLFTYASGSTVPEEQKKLYEALFSTLRREPKETLAVLRNTYGLGTLNPSPLALDIPVKIGLRESCTFLLKSQRYSQQLKPSFYHGPREDVQRAVESLQCGRAGG